MFNPNLLKYDILSDLFHYEPFVYFFFTLIVFWIGKIIYDFLTPFQLDQELTEKDNKAIALSFSGYLTGLGIVLWGILSDPARTDFLNDLLNTFIWSMIAIILLQIARLLMDKILLYRFDNIKELVDDKNIGTAAVEAGGYIGISLIISAVLKGESQNFIISLFETVVFFIIGIVGFVLFAFIYQKTTNYDLHDEIEKDNIAAGTAFGFSLTSIGIILSSYLYRSYSIVGFVAYLIIGIVLLTVSRFLLDKIILPKSPLDKEISQDKNWGAALIEGSISLIIALIVTASF